MTQKYRTYLAEPGEAQYAGVDPFVFIDRLDQFQSATGLDAEDIAPTRLIGVPLVSVDDIEVQQSVRQSVHAEMLWHPMFWLPAHLATRAEVSFGDEEEAVEESVDEWGIRVMATLTRAGIYDPETAKWFDVLSFYGLDVDDPETVERIQRWQDGAEDEVLDRVTLDDHLVLALTDGPETYADAAHLATLIGVIVAHRDAQAVRDYIATSELEGEINLHDLALQAASAALVSFGSVAVDEEGTTVSERVGKLLETDWMVHNDEAVLDALSALCGVVEQTCQDQAMRAQNLFEEVGAAA